MRHHKKHETGATMVEYTIMVAVFAILLIIAVGLMREAVENGFRKTCIAVDQIVEEDVDCGSAPPAPTT